MEDVLVDCILSKDVATLTRLLQDSAAAASGSSSEALHRRLVNGVLRGGSTLLNVAIASRSFDAARALIDSGCDVNQPDSFRVDGCRYRPIHYAADAGCLELVRFFVERCGVDVDEKDEGGSTPLHHACHHGHIDTVEYLTSAGSCISHRSNSGRTALWKAATEGHREIVHLLFALGADVNTQNQVGETVLFDCCRRVRLSSLVIDLVQFGATLTVRDVEGNTALHPAAVAGNTVAVEVLVAAGVPVNCRNEYGNTPLHNAALHGQTEVAVALLNRGAVGDARNYRGQSVLYVSMLHIQMNTCRLLYFGCGTPLTAEDRATFLRYEYSRSVGKREFYRWLTAMFDSPLTLSAIARVVIRRHLRVDCVTSVAKLPLPESVRRFLLLDDLLVF